ncbi:MAG: glycosyltransferase family 2 protein, partial [Dehalococcoidia bacterium]
MTLLDALAPARAIRTATAPPEADKADGTRVKPGAWPVVARPPGAVTMGTARLLLLVTGVAWLAYLYEQIERISRSDLTMRMAIEAGVYFVLVGLLTASSAAYLLARTGYFERIKGHRRVARSTLDDFFAENSPSLTVLVPSYREEPRVVQQTLLSAALQEYPNLRIALLIDDPADAMTVEQRRTLEACRALPAMIAAALREPHNQFRQALDAFEQQPSAEAFASTQTLWTLARNYDDAVLWFESMKQSLPRIDHTDDFLISEVLDGIASDLRRTAEAIRDAAAEPHHSVPLHRVRQLYRRLERIFNAELTSFERKQFASLSHEPNKAMNLNSYIGLMGGNYRIVQSRGGRFIVPAGDQAFDLSVPDSDYVLTLDADSMLLPEYCLRLIHLMEQKENADVAVAQTPYSSYRNPSSQLERIAGATTDIQHIVHQGLTRDNATFWVGANAVIRKSALVDIE